MENYLGRKIRELRRSKDLTQEQLADYLNISYQSVSKWETGTTLPDLSYIIPLSRLFEISTDELLGYEQSKEDLLKNEYSDAYEATWRDGNLEKRLEICLEAVRNYPGDMEWMSRLAMAHSMHCYSYEDNERYCAEREEAIRCYKIVIENTTNEKMKEEAISAIVQDLSYAGKKSEARQYALLYPEEKRDEIEKYYLEGEELIKHEQKLMMKELGHLLSRLNLFFDDYHLHIAVELIKLFFPDENYLDNHYIMYFYQVSKSKQLIKDGDLSQALVHLEKARFHAVEADKIEFDDRGEYAYTSPLFDKLSVDAESAKKYASMANSYAITSNQMTPRFLEGDEAVKLCQSNIQTLVDMIWGNTYILCWKGNYSPNDRIKAFQFAIDCFSLLYSDGNFGFYHERISQCYEEMADNYLKLNEEDNMFTCLEKAAEHAVKYDSRQDGMYTAFMVNKVELSVNDAYKTYTGNVSGRLMKQLKGEKYSCFENNPRMMKTIEKLTPVAIM